LKQEIRILMAFSAVLLVCCVGATDASAEALIIDHNCIDLSQIPAEWIDTTQEQIKLHYGHTSHGSQLTTGLDRLMMINSRNYFVSMSTSGLPTEEGALCIYHPSNDPAAYYANTQGILDANPIINVSMFSWCCQATYSDWEDYLDEYLTNMQAFEAANPDVTFTYMTGNAQADGESGYNRYQFNEEIRAFCRDNEKVLFDFADLDAWFDGEQHTYRYNRYHIPLEHPHFNGNEAGHTTYESCEQKGRAVWWMMARLAGWEPDAADEPYINLDANGEPDFLSVGCDEAVTVALCIGDDGCSTPPYELWLAADTPFGWFSYVYPTGWQPDLTPTIDFDQDGMVDVADFPIFEGCLGAPGDYTFYAALDTNLDDQPSDVDVMDFVTVQSAIQ